MRSCVFLSRNQTAASESLMRYDICIGILGFLLQTHIQPGEYCWLYIAQDEIQEQMLCSSENF